MAWQRFHCEFPIAAGLFFAALASAQDPASFEVATIKPSPPGHIGFQIFSPGPGRLSVLTGTVKDLIKVAFSLRDNQVIGGPGWLGADAFDINAKATEPLDYGQLRPLLRPLLAERFGLTFHFEKRTLPVYMLVVKNTSAGLKEVPAPGFGIGGGKGRLRGSGADISTLASVLSDQLGRVVVDQTGLKGNYDFILEFAPDDKPDDDKPDSAGASIFTAIQEQLGLKLEPGHAPLNVLVIDRVTKPSEN